MVDSDSDVHFDRDPEEDSTSDLGSDVDAGSDVSAEPNIAEIDAYLGEAVYPATREDLVVAAEEAEADESVLSILRHLPDHTYLSEVEVNEALSERNVDNE